MSMSAPFGGGGGYWYDIMSVMGSFDGSAGWIPGSQGFKVDFKVDGATAAM
jgi:hypothetical protein